MEYLKPKFSVASPGTDEYQDRWEQTFGPKTCARCGAKRGELRGGRVVVLRWYQGEAICGACAPGGQD